MVVGLDPWSCGCGSGAVIKAARTIFADRSLRMYIHCRGAGPELLSGRGYSNLAVCFRLSTIHRREIVGEGLMSGLALLFIADVPERDRRLF